MHTGGLFLASSTTAPPWAVYAALIAAAAGLVGQWFARLKEVRDRRRDEYSKAFAAAMLWLEFAYRIARRLSNEPDQVTPIVLAMHDAQEQILFHLNWLRSVSEGVADAYTQLVDAVKKGAEAHMQEAWRGEPATMPEGMIIGARFAVDVSPEVNKFTREVRRDLSWWCRISS